MTATALGSSSFRLYLGVNFLSLNGIWINRILMSWLAWSYTGSAAWVGIVSSLLFAPTLLAGPFFGVLADRIDIRRGAVVTQILLALIMLTLWTVHSAGALDIAGLAAIAFAFGLTASANHPIRLTLVPLLVPQSNIPNAITLISINFNIARLLGPAVGGLLIERLGPGPAMLISLAMTLPMLVAILFLRPRLREESKDGPTPLLAQLREGARHVLRSEMIRQAMVVTLIAAVIARGALEVLPAVADGMFGRGARGLGQMLSSAGAGALISGAVIMLDGGRRPHADLMRRSWVWMLIGILAVCGLAAIDHWWVAMLMVFVMGASGTFTSIYTQSAIQLETSDAYRGRVVSLWLFVGMGGNAAGAVIFGALADAIGMRRSLLTIALVGLAAAIPCMFRARKNNDL
ncbi:MFS transporter [Nitratireductor soli]|uniref:MFS transporter n=1 Tax=Nitratireductor soli TaxID=1670619 RepID=UPI00065E6FEB|nr:MFS transporter [Nitratireductor soli]